MSENVLSNEEVLQMITTKMEEKNEVIREQQMQIQDLQGKLAEVQEKVTQYEEEKNLRESLIQSITQALD